MTAQQSGGLEDYCGAPETTRVIRPTSRRRIGERRHFISTTLPGRTIKARKGKSGSQRTRTANSPCTGRMVANTALGQRRSPVTPPVKRAVSNSMCQSKISPTMNLCGFISFGQPSLDFPVISDRILHHLCPGHRKRFAGNAAPKRCSWLTPVFARVACLEKDFPNPWGTRTWATPS